MMYKDLSLSSGVTLSVGDGELTARVPDVTQKLPRFSSK